MLWVDCIFMGLVRALKCRLDEALMEQLLSALSAGLNKVRYTCWLKLQEIIDLEKPLSSASRVGGVDDAINLAFYRILGLVSVLLWLICSEL